MNDIEKERYEETLEQSDAYYVSILPDLEQELKDMRKSMEVHKRRTQRNYIEYDGMTCMVLATLE